MGFLTQCQTCQIYIPLLYVYMYVFGTCVLACWMVYIQSVQTLHTSIITHIESKCMHSTHSFNQCKHDVCESTHIQSVCALHISINTHTINVNVINHSHTHTVIESINVDGTRRVKTRKCLLGIYNNWNG